MGYRRKASIAVRNLEIHVKKGLYPSEALVENRFLLSAKVCYNPDAIAKGEYLNYERLAEILKEEMHSDTSLLELLAEQILDRILKEWPEGELADIRIEKLHPPFKNYNLEAVIVEMEKQRV